MQTHLHVISGFLLYSVSVSGSFTIPSNTAGELNDYILVPPTINPYNSDYPTGIIIDLEIYTFLVVKPAVMFK